MYSAYDCHARAAEDTAAAADAALPNERSSLERSAFAWRLRAELLERETLTRLRGGR